MGNTQIINIQSTYPETKFNLLGNTTVATAIPDIQKPVIQVITLNTDPAQGDVYLQQRGSKGYTDRNGYQHSATPDKYAITKNGLKKLADGAGIKMISSEHVLPAVCQKCVAINQTVGKQIFCGNCKHGNDIAFRVTITVPQLTGEVITVEDTNEVNVANTTANMSEKQKAEYLKFLPQICEAKALNGAIRTALHLKGTYTLQELQKPFVVAYLVPNLDNADVKQVAIQHMFGSAASLYGKQAPTVEQIETKAPDVPMIEASDQDQQMIDNYVNSADDQAYVPMDEQSAYEPADSNPYEPADTPQQTAPQPQMPPQQQNDGALYCSECGALISDKVYEYSTKKFGVPLCMKCQKGAR